jgi:protein-tyrosine-phosphatase
MKKLTEKYKLSIWTLALGYFLFYIPYSGMTKVLSRGLFSKDGGAISGLEILPLVLLGTVIGFLAILLITGWWKHAGTVKIFGISIPFISNKFTFFSGIATAVIIATTTLAYSFTGISIVFAALLMRGGVLLIAPFIDVIYKRKIQWYSWMAFGLTLFSLLIVFSEKAEYNLSLAAIINIVAYLSGYFFRLQFMTYAAKSDDSTSNYKFFVEELLSATLMILLIPVILALIGQGEFMLSIRAGYSTFLSSGLIIPAVVIGLLYSCLYIFGTRIYLDRRENTFCIPINRVASLLAGVCSAILLSIIFGTKFYSVTQLFGAQMLVLAIFALSIPKIIEAIRHARGIQNRTFLFVCPGNTGRSPMAQAICLDRMVLRLSTSQNVNKRSSVHVLSAGINGDNGTPIHGDAKLALAHLGIKVMPHFSHILTSQDIEKVDKIWCITPEHMDLILQKFPNVQTKINCLDKEGTLPVPHGNGLNAYIECAKKLEEIIDSLIYKKEIRFV